MPRSEEQEAVELEYGQDYRYICQSCDGEYPCGCGNPYPQTQLADHIELVEP